MVRLPDAEASRGVDLTAERHALDDTRLGAVPLSALYRRALRRWHRSITSLRLLRLSAAWER